MKKLLLLIALSCWSLNAATYYVSTSGNASYDGSAPAFVSGTTGPKRTILQGIQLLSPGDTLIMRGGIYEEPSIDLPMSINGSSDANRTILKSYPGERAIFYPTTHTKHGINAAGSTQVSSNLTFDGWTIDFRRKNIEIQGHESIANFKMYWCTNITLTNMHFVNNTNGSLTHIYTSNFYSTRGSGGNVHVVDCLFSNVTSVLLSDGHRHNPCHPMYWNTVSDVLVERNLFIDGARTDIHTQSFGLHVYGGYQADRWIVRNNWFDGFVAATAFNVNNGKLYNNVFVNIEGAGIGQYSRNSLYANNTLVGNNGTSAIKTFGYNDDFVNNVAWGFGTGIEIAADFTTDRYLTFTNNILPSGIIRPTSGNPYFTGTINANPLFTDPPDDVSLGVGSPAIKTGVDLSSIFTTDYTGATRVAPWDRGAYAFETAAPSGNTYYVRKDGNDSNTGTADNAGGAWLTIGKAASVVNPGDVVYVRAGTYDEYVNFTRSGNSDDPITWIGERDGDDWLTIVDDSEAMPQTGWTQAIGAFTDGQRAWKRTFSYQPGLITINDLSMLEMRWSSSAQTEGWWNLNKLGYASNRTTGDGIPTDGTALWWAGFESMWAYTNGIVYVRFRDESTPVGKTMRVSPRDVAWNISGASYNTIQGFNIRGARYPMQWVNDVQGIVVEQCLIEQGHRGISATGNTRDCVIRDNVFRGHHASVRPYGPRRATNPDHNVEYQMYSRNKFEWGLSAEGPAIGIFNPGTNNQITDNVITNIAVGVMIEQGDNRPQSARDASPTMIYGNTVRDSLHGIMIGAGHGTMTIASNALYRVHYGLRFQNFNVAPANNTKFYYVYGNTIGSTNSVGSGAFFHAWPMNQLGNIGNPSTTAANRQRMWMYHNSFSGLYNGLYMSDVFNQEGGLPTLYVANNLFSTLAALRGATQTTPMRNAGEWGALDYNAWKLRTENSQSIADAGPNNVVLADYEWPISEEPSSWNISSSSEAAEEGINISSSFTVKSVNHSALPGYSPGYFTGTAPHIGESQAVGQTIYVSTTGSDSGAGTLASPYKTIKKGIEMLSAGGTLVLRGGTYQESLGRPDAMRMIPSGPSESQRTRIASYPGERAVWRPAFESATDIVHALGSDYLVSNMVLDSWTIDMQDRKDGESYSRGSMIKAAAKNVLLTNMWFINHPWGSGIQFQHGAGGRLDVSLWSSNANIVSCVFSNFNYTTPQEGHPIYSWGIWKSTWENNLFIEGKRVAIQYGGTEFTGTTSDLTIRNNRIMNGPTASFNHGIWNNSSPQDRGTNTWIYNNSIQADDTGIKLSGRTNYVFNNTIIPSRSIGFEVAGILMSSGYPHIVANNIVWGTPDSASGDSILNQTAYATSYLTNNIAGPKLPVLTLGNVTQSGNFWGPQFDPIFTDAPTDLRISNAGAAAGTGVNLGAVFNTDINGFTRQNWDIGAYAVGSQSGTDDPEEPPPVITYPRVSVTQAGPAYETGPTAATFTIFRDNFTDDLDVSYTLTGTAVEDTNFTISPASPVTIPGGQNSVTVTVTPIDTQYIGTLTVILSLDEDTAYTLSAPTNATMEIYGAGVEGTGFSRSVGGPARNAGRSGP